MRMSVRAHSSIRRHAALPCLPRARVARGLPRSLLRRTALAASVRAPTHHNPACREHEMLDAR